MTSFMGPTLTNQGHETGYTPPGSLLGSLPYRPLLPVRTAVEIWSNKPIEPLKRELKHHSDVPGIVPDKDSVIPIVGARFVESCRIDRC